MKSTLGIFAALSFAVPIICMNDEQWMRRNHEGTEAEIEFSARCRLFAIDNDTSNSNLISKKMTYKNKTVILITPKNNQAHLRPQIIPTTKNSKMIFSEDERYLLVSESSKQFRLNKIVRIYDVTTGKEVYAYCGGFREIRDMKLAHNGAQYVLTIAGVDILKDEPKHGTYYIDPFAINMTDQIIRI